MNKNLYAFFILCLVILSVLSCTGNHSPNPSHQDLYQNVVSWLNENTLDTDSIVLPLIEKGNFGNRPVFNIPQSVDTFGVMDTVRTVKPEFVLAVNSIVWDGVTQQP